MILSEAVLTKNLESNITEYVIDVRIIKVDGSVLLNKSSVYNMHIVRAVHIYKIIYGIVYCVNKLYILAHVPYIFYSDLIFSHYTIAFALF